MDTDPQPATNRYNFYTECPKVRHCATENPDVGCRRKSAPFRVCNLIDIFFITMNLIERVGAERTVWTDRVATTRHSIGRVPGSWLASYPVFEEALRNGEATFSALPDFAKRVVLKRVAINEGARYTSKILGDVRVSFNELSTDAVSAVVDSYLGKQQLGNASSDGLATSLESLAEWTSATDYPLIERSPCLLRTGHHVFLDSWMRFFSYRARGDRTIPVLAIDWLDVYHKLSALPPIQPHFVSRNRHCNT
ncbi:hypothetical protein [Burkholderia multivorans]|uniref:hypothetical protein n=1 Tax=Burkholderia multivorans TaxID=87883 RepID=UPI0021C1E684|nr:hypothetical protein [Burkholderia multivorans]